MSEPDASGTAPDMLSLDAFDAYAFCPRRAWYELNGSPARTQGEKKEAEPAGPDFATNAGTTMIRLSSAELGLYGQVCAGISGNSAQPIENRRGSPRSDGSAWPSDELELGARALLLRKHGYVCRQGTVTYHGTVPFTPLDIDINADLTARAANAIAALHEIAQAEIPPVAAPDMRCAYCPVSAICLPDETLLLRKSSGATDGENNHEREVRRVVPIRPDGDPFIVQRQGTVIGKSDGLLIARERDKVIAQVRLAEVSHVCVFGAVQITSQAMQELLRNAIPVFWYSTGGWLHGWAGGFPAGNVHLRRRQYEVGSVPEKSLVLAREFVSAKIANCAVLLRRNAGSLQASVADALRKAGKEAAEATSLDRLRGVEGAAARLYFEQFPALLKDGEANRFDFQGRNRRPPVDPVNALLSFAYAMLAKDATAAIAAAGMDPMMGFLHAPRHGRPAAALDLMEEFRPVLADSVVVSAVNRRVVQSHEFDQAGDSCSLKSRARRRFIELYEQRLDSQITHPIFGYRISYRAVLVVQARLLARSITGEIPAYPGFRIR